MTAALVMVVIVVVVGAGAYVAFANMHSGGNQTRQVCTPATSAACEAVAGTHDLQVLAPLKSAQTGSLIPFTVILPNNEVGSNYKFTFGDGTSTTSATPTVSHVYANPGTYLVQVGATVGGVTHDNLAALTVLTLSASYAAISAGNAPSVDGTILANSSSSSAASAVVHAGGSVTFQGSFLGPPTNPNFVPSTPSLTVTPSGPTGSSVKAGATSSTQTYTFPQSGTYVVSFIGRANGTGPFAGQSAYQNYSWTVVVAPTGAPAGIAGTAVANDPHPGTVIYYSNAQGGASTLDPSIAYDTVSYEPILSVYEGLIMYNGSQTGPEPSNYLPVLSTCVPGPSSASCQAMYGSSLYDPTTSTYTFPIVKNAMFYDPSTGKSWNVWPSDVVFSVARTMAFADQPAAGAHNGWILTQSLLPGRASPVMAANRSWDGGIHYPYNNTPQAVFASMDVNGSACTAALLANSNGCVTFHATGNAQNWPYFLELIADQQGASVESCSWISSSASSGGQAGIPYWTARNVTDAGDHPCLLPGASSSSTSSSFTNAVAGIPPTAWDSYELLGSGVGNSGGSIGNVVKAMVGSGPFYLSNYVIGSSYTLKASPVYQPNTACTWTWCMPAVGHTAKTVEVTWETDISQGEQALAAGVADTATVPRTDTALLLQLVEQGKVNVLAVPTISIYWYPYTLDFSLSGAQKFTTNPITVKTDWFTYVGMRNFFTTAYPYTTIESTVLTQDGIQSGFNYGGAIPQFMANYYPTNISWPSQDPAQACAGAGASTPSCPTYWWTQMTTPSSPYYDPEAAACTTSSPCQLPLIGETGAPTSDVQQNLWVNSLNALSGGKLKVTYTDINFGNLVSNSLFSAPYQNPMPFYTLGWAPDYPDPTDYVTPAYLPDSSYTYSDAVAEQFASLNSSSCSQNLWDYVNAKVPVSESCQGAAYNLMVNALNIAAVLPAGPERVLLYNAAEHIANDLALYVYQYQENENYVLSTWVNAGSIDTNVTTGGGTDFVWWTWNGNGVWGSG